MPIILPHPLASTEAQAQFWATASYANGVGDTFVQPLHVVRSTPRKVCVRMRTWEVLPRWMRGSGPPESRTFLLWVDAAVTSPAAHYVRDWEADHGGDEDDDAIAEA
jgi:hypothetical protein